MLAASARSAQPAPQLAQLVHRRVGRRMGDAGEQLDLLLDRPGVEEQFVIKELLA